MITLIREIDHEVQHHGNHLITGINGSDIFLLLAPDPYCISLHYFMLDISGTRYWDEPIIKNKK